MKAPEKIYVADVTFPDFVDFDGSPINTKRIDDHDIEYTTTDAFIEKAENYLKNQFIKDVSVLAGGAVSINFINTAISNFINYMKDGSR